MTSPDQPGAGWTGTTAVASWSAPDHRSRAEAGPTARGGRSPTGTAEGRTYPASSVAGRWCVRPPTDRVETPMHRLVRSATLLVVVPERHNAPRDRVSTSTRTSRAHRPARGRPYGMAQIQEHAAAGATADAPIPRQQNRRAPQHARANDE